MNVLIAEDEVQYANTLKQYLERFCTENNLTCNIEIYNNGADLVEHYVPKWDIVFLDIDMPGMNGISVAKSIRETDTTVGIMFVTNLAQYAIKGYEVQALDYILKPVSYYAISMKLKRIIGMLTNNNSKSILLNKDGDVYKMNINDIYYVEVVNHSIIYHTTDGLIKYTGNNSLTKISKELENYGFVRCHNSYLINLRHVNGLIEDNVQVAGERIPVSRNKKKDLMEALLAMVKKG